MGPTTIMSWCRPHCTTTAQATADGPGDAQGLKEEDLVWNNSPGKWGGVTKLTARQRGAENVGQTLSVGRIPAMVAAFSPPGLARIWLVCVRTCVSHSAYHRCYAHVTCSCGVVLNSVSSMQAHSLLELTLTFPLVPADSALILSSVL